MKSFKKLSLMLMLAALMAFVAACGGANNKDGAKNEDMKQLEGEVKIDGSSTVFPIMEAVVEEYQTEQPNVKVSVGSSGTGGGFKAFAAGETDISDASRPIKDEEKQALKDAGIEYTEFEIAKDGLSVVVNKDNDFVDTLTIEQLKKMWTGDAKKWSDINPEWPAEEIKYYSPGTDSGTFDYFDEVILNEEPIVKSATLSEDDNILVQGVTGDKNAIGYFGYAYYLENKDKLKVVKIDGGKGAVEPTAETVQSGEYAPLSRPLFIYVKNKAVKEKPEVYDYMKYALDNAGAMAEEVGYVALPDEDYKKAIDTLEGLK